MTPEKWLVVLCGFACCLIPASALILWLIARFGEWLDGDRGRAKTMAASGEGQIREQQEAWLREGRNVELFVLESIIERKKWLAFLTMIGID